MPICESKLGPVRNHVSDSPACIELLNKVEFLTQYPIDIFNMAENQSGACLNWDCVGGKRRFFIRCNEKKISSPILAHELMHLLLHFEGWKTVECITDLNKRLTKAGQEHTHSMFAFIYALIEHIEIWERLSSCNLIDSEWQDREVQTIIDQFQDGLYAVTCQFYPPLPLTGCKALYLASILLCPCRADLKEVVRSLKDNHCISYDMKEALCMALQIYELLKNKIDSLIVQDVFVEINKIVKFADFWSYLNRCLAEQ